MKRVKYLFLQLIVAAFILICVGCASSTKTAEMIALTAAQHISAYEQGVGKKIKSENDYYGTIMQNVITDIKEIRESEQSRELVIEVEEFAKENSGKSVDEITPKIIEFMEASKNSWAEREEQYVQLIEETKDALGKNQQTLEIAETKISQLKNKLTALSDARSHKEMLTLMVAYAGEVKNELDSLQEDSSKASATVGDAMNNIKSEKEKPKKKKETDKKGKTDKADKNPNN